MPPKTKKTRKRSSAAKTIPNRCRTLMVIDDTPIRQKAMRHCRAALKQRDKARSEWENFDKTDRPAFTQWLHQEFGPDLTRMHEIDQKIFEAEALIQQVEFEAVMGEISDFDAYDRVMRQREDPDHEDPNGENRKHEEADPNDGDPFADFDDDDIFGDLEDEVKNFFRETFGCSEEEGEDAFKRNEPHPRSTAPPEPCSRIKEVYRTLVRRLHPDTNEQSDAKKQDLWHAVQEAYQTRNLERLESLLARCDLEEDVVDENMPISQLQRSWREIKNAVNSLRRQLRRAKKDPAWLFSSQTRAERNAIKREIDQDLKSDLKRRTFHLNELQTYIDRWEKRRRNRTRTKSSKSGKKPSEVPPRNKKTTARPKEQKRPSPDENPLQGEFAF